MPLGLHHPPELYSFNGDSTSSTGSAGLAARSSAEISEKQHHHDMYVGMLILLQCPDLIHNSRNSRGRIASLDNCIHSQAYPTRGLRTRQGQDRSTNDSRH